MTILTTRPEHQAHHLIAKLHQIGHHAINIPVMRIDHLTDSDSLGPEKGSACIILTSANAVPGIATALDKKRNELNVICLGPATAARAKQAGCARVAVAPPPYGTDALLNSQLLDTVPTNEPIIVCTGVECSQRLVAALNQKFLNVNVLHTYRRRRTESFLPQRLTTRERDAIEVIVSTSYDGLRFLWDMTPPDWQQWLRETPLLVVSHRMRAFAKQQHHCCIIQANDASDSAIVAALQKHLTLP